MVEYDILIKDATIVEGTGKKAYKGTIGVTGDKVASIGDVKGDAKKVIKAKALSMVPNQ